MIGFSEMAKKRLIKENEMEKRLPFSCPVCARKTDYAVKELFEGAILNCPFCKLIITLHGHMWKDVQKEIQKLRNEK